jgi:hypothetical protein
MPNFTKPLEEWLNTVRGITLSNDPNNNMVLFKAAQARRSRIRTEQLTAFLEEAYREYYRKASLQNRRGWFYAWYDEMSDTLRCSLHDAASALELPFRCELDVVDDPMSVAAGALARMGDGTIPIEAMRIIDFVEDDQESDYFELIVFARYIKTVH